MNRVVCSLSWDSLQDSQSDDIPDGKEPIKAADMDTLDAGLESKGPQLWDPYNDEYDENSKEENPCPKESDDAVWLDKDNQDFDPDDTQYDNDNDDKESDHATCSDEDDQELELQSQVQSGFFAFLGKTGTVTSPLYDATPL
jgi:hypothetical protein